MTVFMPVSTRRRLAFAASAAIAAVIAYLSLMPGDALPNVSGSDKIKHALAYAALAAPMTLWLGVRRWWLVLVVCVGYGLSMEAGQGLMGAGRTLSAWDAVANWVGACVGVVCASAVAVAIPRRSYRP